MPAQQVLRIFFKLFPPFASAVQSDSVRRPMSFVGDAYRRRLRFAMQLVFL